MTLQQLRYIIEIAQSGSISLAAQRLFITQPSLSKSVADLEKEMGITIFYRGSRGVMLSPDGVKFLAYARQVVEQADLLEQQYKFGTPGAPGLCPVCPALCSGCQRLHRSGPGIPGGSV